MKVLLVTNLYGRHARGGAERVVDSIIEGLRGLGHEPVVLTAGTFEGVMSLWPRVDSGDVLEAKLLSTAQGARSLASRRVKVYRFFPLNFFSIVNIGRYPMWLRLFWHAVDLFNDHPAWMLLWLLRKEKPDLVWTHNLKGLGGWIPRMLRWSGIPHIHHLHDVQLIEPSGLMFPETKLPVYGAEAKLVDSEAKLPVEYCPEAKLPVGSLASVPLYCRIQRWMFCSPTLVASPTKWLLELHQQNGFFPKSKTLVLAHPTPSCPVRVERPLRSLLPERSRRPTTGDAPFTLRQAQGINGGLVNLLFAGQLAEHKGIRFLVDALKEAHLPFSWELHIAGTGALEQQLRAQLADDPRFIFHGKLAAEPFEAVWWQTNLTIVPSLCLENAPAVIAESLARGIPVLASRVGGIPEMIEEGRNGWLFEAGNTKVFLRTLQLAFEKIQGGFEFTAPAVRTPSQYAGEILLRIKVLSQRS